MLSIPIVTSFSDTGVKSAIKEFKQLETTGKKAQFALKKAVIPATAAVAGLGAALFDATKGAIEDAAAQDLLANNLRRTTGATDAQIAANEDWISTQGRLLGVTDDELRPVLAKLAKATGDVTLAQQYANQAMDIATATGKPLATVTDAVAKAMGGNMTALAKLAPEYRTLIKDGADFETVMSLIADTTGGAASQAANTAQGQFKRLQVSLAETKESIGAALLPAVNALLPKLTALGAWASANPEVFSKVALAIGGVATAVIAVNAALAINPYVLAAAGVVVLAVAFDRLANSIEKANKFAGALFRSLGNFTGIGGLANAGNLIGNLFKKSKGKGGGSLFDFLDSIPGLAEGGIVTSPTLALIGEGGGPEAVVPLSRAGEFGMGGGNNVTINVNGGDPRAVVDALRKYMQTHGAVPIRIGGA